jgi:hypothetical protein
MSSTEDTPQTPERARFAQLTATADLLATALLAFNGVDLPWYCHDNGYAVRTDAADPTGYRRLADLFESVLSDVAEHARVLDRSPWTGRALREAWTDSSEPIRYYLDHPEYAGQFAR